MKNACFCCMQSDDGAGEVAASTDFGYTQIAYRWDHYFVVLHKKIVVLSSH